jgi:hypothetical protein
MRVLGLALAAGLAVVASVAARAAPLGSNMERLKTVPAPAIVQVWDGCGWGWHPVPGHWSQWRGGWVPPHCAPNRHYGGWSPYGGGQGPYGEWRSYGGWGGSYGGRRGSDDD